MEQMDKGRSVMRSKYNATNEDFARTWDRCLELVPATRTELLVEKAAEEVRRHAAGKRVAYGWSGGKDSQALRVVAERAGIFDCVLSFCSLEWPDMERWVKTAAPPGLVIERKTEVNLDFLVKHPHLLFPASGKIGYFYSSKITHWGQQKYYSERALDLMLYGRRHQDGNFIGPGGVHTNRNGFTQLCPLRDWTHEETMAVAKRAGLPMPPVYNYANGWKSGTGPWSGRQGFATKTDGWMATWTADPDVVREAATKLDSAREFMAVRGLT